MESKTTQSNKNECSKIFYSKFLQYLVKNYPNIHTQRVKITSIRKDLSWILRLSKSESKQFLKALSQDCPQVDINNYGVILNEHIQDGS